ncbi:MAG: hypothetical protein WCP30_11495 [Mycobacteriaceae bacterium]
MKRIRLAVTIAGLMSAATIGAGAASADDYTTLLIDPNFVFDTVQYTGGAPTMNPGGQPGAARVFSHNDGRSITDTVWVLPDPAAATAAVTAAQTAAAIANPKTEPVQVGTGGTFISGTSADGSQSLGLLTFTQGNAASTIEFAGPANDPPDAALATDLGQAQVALIQSRMGG